MKIRLLKFPATLLATKYNYVADGSITEAVIDTEKNEVEFFSENPNFSSAMPLKSDGGFVIGDAAYYDKI